MKSTKNSNLDNLIKKILREETTSKKLLKEAVLPNITLGDTLCDIICEKKQAKFGANGNVVKEIQHALAKCGFNPKFEGGGINPGCSTDVNKCDGKFRTETQKAVIEFQKSIAELTPDGAVGKKTLQALEKEGCIKPSYCECKKIQISTKEDKKYGERLKDENKRFLEDTIGITNVNCDKIIYCIRTIINSNPLPAKQISVDALKKCLLEKLPNKETMPVEKKLECGNCPEGYVNCMPGTSKPDPYCSNKLLRQYCETMCGTKVAV